MSQEQPRRPEEAHRDPVKYGDVFPVSGDLAKEPIAPKDAAFMQTAETTVFGGVQPGGPAAVMGGAAVANERMGMDDPGAGNRDVTITATDYPGGRIVTESVGGQVVGQYFQSAQVQPTAGVATNIQSQITIGEALEAAARVCGDKPVDKSDAAAIQEAEKIVIGNNEMIPGGVADTADTAAEFNAGVGKDEDKVKLSYVLSDATIKLPGDKVATRDDADRVASAEQRNNPNLTTNPAGVASSIATAARLNERSLK